MKKENINKEKNQAALSSVVASFFLTAFKLVVGLVTGSLGILSEALHSGLDMVAAVITFVSVRISDKPADNDHNYGHDKIENLSAFFETILLLITCVWIIYEASERLLTGNTHIEVSIWSFVIVITSIIVDINRSRNLKKVAKKHNSQALEADGIHFATDILSSAVVLLGLILAKFNIFWADSVAALGVAVIVLHVSYKLGKSAIDVLLDKAPKENVEKVKKYLDENGYDYHDFKMRTSGADTFMKFNLHYNERSSVKTAHTLCDKIEKDIQEIIPRSEIYIHLEPDSEEHKNSESNSDI